MLQVFVALYLTLSWRGPLSYRNLSISKSVDWFLYDNGLRHERLKQQIDRIELGCDLKFKNLKYL